MELADTSAWTWKDRDSAVAADFARRARRHQIATCDMVRMEILMSARDAAEVASWRRYLARLPDCPIAPPQWQRALDVMEALARRGPLHHRQVKLPDLLIAAAAEEAEMTLLHYDRHFELIAEATGQPVRAIARLGSLSSAPADRDRDGEGE